MYADGEDLILVASDRVSVHDVVLPTPIPDKGAILTQLSLWWFGQVADLGAQSRADRGCPAGVEGSGDSLPPTRDGARRVHCPRLISLGSVLRVTERAVPSRVSGYHRDSSRRTGRSNRSSRRPPRPRLGTTNS